MQTLSIELLMPIAQLQLDPVKFDRHTELLKKNEADLLTTEERQDTRSRSQN
jgi:hypothetical protein